MPLSILRLLLHFIHTLPVLILLLHSCNATCKIEGDSCFCVEDTNISQDDSLSNILAYCCQGDVFQVHINGGQISGDNAFYQKPCHNLIGFRIHAPSQTNLAQNGLAFNGLPNLEVLEITGGLSLTTLPKGVFSGLTASLRQLNLSGNGLTTLTGAEFSGLSDPNSRLDEVDLSNNRLKNLRSGCFKYLRCIKTLNLAGNLITELRADVFVGLEQLEELNLQRNPISVIIGGAFQPLSRLRRLSISSSLTGHPPLVSLTPGMLYGLQALRQLQLSNLGISNINAEALMDLRQLQELDLSGNQLKEVPHIAFKRMVLAQRGGRFQRLNLSNNRIICLPEGAFSEFPQLKSLDLSRNLLTVISDQAFRGIKHIRELSLLENPLLVIIPSAFDEFATSYEESDREAVSIVYKPRDEGELLPIKTVVRIPNDDTIVGINKLRLRALYGRQDDISSTTMAPFIDLSCPRLPLPNRHSSLQHSVGNPESDSQLISKKEEETREGISGFFSQNKVSLIIIVVCALLTLIVTSATILSCQACRKQRKQRRNKITSHLDSIVTSPPLSDAGKSHYSGFSKQNTFSYNSLEAGSTAYSEQLPVVSEKMSTSERLYNLGQKLAPPPYPHNLQILDERLRQVSSTSNPTVPTLFNGYAATARESPHHMLSGQSSPSNLGSSPRFSSSTSSVQQQHRQKVSAGLHLIMSSSVIDHEKSTPPPPSSVSPLHESGIVSDNASSSLITALGVF
nr:Leucine rich repeat domain containing protein [Hymenolepis microstoma]